MAQIEQSSGGKQKKGAQKKMHIHVDFTPMVDMNMLLITFFMLCTTMLKSQTLNIMLPSNEKVTNKDQMTQAKADNAFTIIVDSKREKGETLANGEVAPGKILANYVYYYKGKGVDESGTIIAPLEEPTKYHSTNVNAGVVDNIRDVLEKINKEVLKEINELEKKYNGGKGSMTEQEYKKAQEDIINKKRDNKPVVVIKATDNASFVNLVSALDEMQINGFNTFQINKLNKNDSILLNDFYAKHPDHVQK